MFLEHANFAKEYLAWEQKKKAFEREVVEEAKNLCQRRSQLPSYGESNSIRKYVKNSEDFANDVATTKLNKPKLA